MNAPKKTDFTKTIQNMQKYMKNDTAFAGIVIPESKEVSFECPVHGHQTYTTYQQSDSSWIEPYCPICRAEQKKIENTLREIQSDAKERASDLAKAINSRKTSDYEIASFDVYIPETLEEKQNLDVAKRFAERFTIREIEREHAHQAQERDWHKKNSVGLALLGNYGTGKTLLAYSILKSLEAQGIPGYYITIPDLFDALTNTNDRLDVANVMKKLAVVSCLVLDELGVQSGTEYERKRLYQIIDGRIKNGRPTIIISNLDRDELNRLMTERVMDRIRAACYTLSFTGRSRREKVSQEAEEVF